MGRVQLDRSVAELKLRIKQSESYKIKILSYVEIFKKKLFGGEINHIEYRHFINKKLDGKTIHEWLHLYDSDIERCEELIKKKIKKFKLNKVFIVFSCFVFISMVVFSAFYFNQGVNTFSIKGEEQANDSNLIGSYSKEIQELPQEDLNPSQEGGLVIRTFSAIGKLLEVIYRITGFSVEEVTNVSNESVEVTEVNLSEEILDKNLSKQDEVTNESNESVEVTGVNLTEEILGDENITEENLVVQDEIVVEEIIDVSEPEEQVSKEVVEINVEEGVTVTTQQYGAVLGKPVKWRKRISPDVLGNITLDIPKLSENIIIKKITKVQNSSSEKKQEASQENLNPSHEEPFDSENKSEIKNLKLTITGEVIGNVSYSIKQPGERRGFIFYVREFLNNFFFRIIGAITGRAVEDVDQGEETIRVEIEIDELTEYEIEYETPAPYAIEEEIEGGKSVKIVGPETVHYQNVLVFTDISEEFNVQNPSRVKVYWRENDTYLSLETIQDLDNNGIYDYIEWVVPHLSNQTFDIIVITKAEHLDSNRDFISDIYDDVIELDGNWSETIPNRDYVRVTFEVNLTNQSDITIFSRTVLGNPRIEVYEVNGSAKIAEFSSLNDNEYNVIYLVNFSGSQDVFDLKVIGGAVEFDHIVDPPAKVADNSASCTPTTIDDSGSQTTACAFSLENSGNTFAAQCTLTITDDGTANPITNVCQSGIQFKVDSIALDGGNAECTVNNGDGSVNCGATWASGSDSEDITWTLSGCNGDGLASVIQLEASCNDALNNKPSVTVTGTSDTTYPQFSSFTESPANATTVYSSGASYEFNATIINTNGTVGLEFNGINYTATNVTFDVYNVTITDLPGDDMTYYWWGYGNGTSNNYNSSSTRGYTINESVPEGSLTNSDPWTVTYPEEVIIGLSESNTGDGDVTYKVYRDGVDKGTGETVTLGVGTYNYVLNTTGGQNYTVNSSMDAQTLTVNVGASEVNLTLNNTEGNVTITSGDTILLNGTLITGDSTGRLLLYNNGTLINNATSEVSNSTTFNDAGLFNITVIYVASENYTQSSETWWVNVTAAAVPYLTFVSPTPANATSTSNTSIEINVSITESNLTEVKYNWNGTNYTFYDDDLHVMYNFNNVSALGENDSVIIDFSTSGNNGSVVGSVSLNTTFGKYGGSLESNDGADSYVLTGSNIDSQPSVYTFSAWAYYKSFGDGFGMIWSRNAASGNTILHLLGVRSTGGRLDVGHDGTLTTSTGFTAVTGEWNYYVVRYNGTAVSLFVDAEEKWASVVSALSTSTTCGIMLANDPDDGCTGTLNADDLDGFIDNFMFFNRSLSDDEINQIYMMNLDKYDTDKWALYVNQSKNATDGLDAGIYTYFVGATNGVGENVTETRTITIEAVDNPPTVTLNSPADLSTQSNVTINFSCSVTDDFNLTNISLYGNWSGGWHLNSTTNISGISNSSSWLIGLSDSTSYLWNCYACDGIGNCSFGASNYSFSIDTSLLVDDPFYDGISLGNLDSSADWQEISGLASVRNSSNDGFIWAQSDGSVDLLLAINLSDASNAGEWTLSGINGVDYEDLASATINGTHYIYLADIGDNGDARSTFIIYRIKEPTINGSNGVIDSGDIYTITGEYPSGNLPSHKDAETLLVDPDTGDMYVITKRETVPGVYSLAHNETYSGTQTFVFEGDMWDIPDSSSIAADGNAIGGDISSDGSEILIKNNDMVFLFQRSSNATSIFDALNSTPLNLTSYVGGGDLGHRKSHPSQEPQGEGIAYSRNSQDYFTASEFVSSEGSTSTRYPFFRYNRTNETVTTVVFQDGVSPTASYNGTEDTYLWDLNPTTNYGSDVTFVVDINAGDERMGLLKFNLSSIPTNATIIGARVDLDIAVEGQGWVFHRILSVDWNESSTYNNVPGGAGIEADDVEASIIEDNRNGVTLDTYTGTVRNNMDLDTIQSWVNGSQTNYGWLLNATHATDGQQFSSRNDTTSSERPQLTIRYIVESAENSAPQIINVSSIANTDPTEDGIKYIAFNFTAEDTDGAGDLNNNSVRAEFLKSGETTRVNTSCTAQTIDSTHNRYFCTIGMWYFDLNGAWTINVTINDSAGLVAENSSTTFTYNLLTAMKMNPTALAWPGLGIASTNLGSNTDPITINNTGNDVIINITVTAIDLAGETTSSEYIYAGNFTVNTVDASDNTTMVNGTVIQVDLANLTRGNYSVNDGNTGQEQLYFYLEAINPGTSAQSYSSSLGGEWTITIFSVGIVFVGKASKRKKKKRKKVISNISIPSTIFSKNIGALETVSKYLKENLGMSYHKIAELLNRDDRNIWTAYNKAIGKQKKLIGVTETDIFLPVSIFRKDLTILESVVVYLKEEGLRYNEISKILHRDQRNVWSVYSKAVKKII